MHRFVAGMPYRELIQLPSYVLIVVDKPLEMGVIFFLIDQRQ
jgi:hypothetical protein